MSEWDDWGNESEGKENSDKLEPQEQFDVKPVHLSKSKVAIIIALAIFIFLIVGLTIRSVVISKKVSGGSNNQTPKTTVSQTVETPSNSGEGESKIPDNTASSQEVESTPANTSNTESSNQNSGNTDTTVDFREVAIPQLGDEIETKGIVLGKKCYKYGNGYLYCLEISMVYGDITQTVNYFCPKKSFDSVESGTVLNVVYQVDQYGVFSIKTISKI